MVLFSICADFRHCTRCKVAYYCGSKCQKRDWKHLGHKQVCIKVKEAKEEDRDRGAAAAPALAGPAGGGGGGGVRGGSEGSDGAAGAAEVSQTGAPHEAAAALLNTVVTLHGLGAAQHNGKVGHVAGGLVEETGRWPVFVFADSKKMLLKPTNLAASPGTDAIEAFLHALTDGDKCKAFGNGVTMRPWDDGLLCAGARWACN